MQEEYYASGGFRPVLGPYEVFGYSGRAQPQEVVSVPFDNVRGGILCAQVLDNLSTGVVTDSFSFYNRFLACAIVEVSLFGLVKGVACNLITVALRQLTGPFFYPFDGSEAYENISVRARMMRAGLRNPPAARSDGTIDGFAGGSAKLSLTIMKGQKVERSRG